MANLSPREFPDLDWSDSKSAAAELVAYVMGNAEDARSWYLVKKDGRKFWAQGLRALAVVLTTIAAVIPAYITFMPSNRGADASGEAALAYVFLGVAGGVVWLDRSLGLSSSWMRFMTTAVAISEINAELRWSWERWKLANPGTVEDAARKEIFEACYRSANKLHNTLTDELEAWKVEFKATMKEIEAAVNQRQAKLDQGRASQRPGALNITVSNGDQCVDGWHVQCGPTRTGPVTGKTATLNELAPGLIRVDVTGVVGSKAVAEHRTIRIEPGTIQELEVTLS